MLISAALSSTMMGSVAGLNQAGMGISLLWNSICNYIDANGMVSCTWVAFSPSVPPTPDPLGSVMGKVITAAGRSLDPYLVGIDQVRDCPTALSMLSNAMNMATLQWQAILPPTMGFVVSPGPAISPASIVLTPSMTKITSTAFDQLSAQIMTGLLTVSFAPSGGIHGIYSGTGVYIPGIH